MNQPEFYIIDGQQNGIRIESRVLEEALQQAVAEGKRWIEVKAFGQHGIGGRLWKAGNKRVHIRISGQAGQRSGSMGFPNTRIEIMGPVSDDLGWLNAGAEIIVHGHAGNGTANAMAQGKLYIAGNIGARGMTMTKSNPRFAPPEMWVLGSVGDYFGEFMAGGIAVICGIEPQTPDNILGYRPLVGMVGGQIFCRGRHQGYSTADAKPVAISDNAWHWLETNLVLFLKRIGRPELRDQLTERNQWQLLTARSPREKVSTAKRSMASFRAEVWDRELGAGGLIGDLTTLDRSPVPVITTGDLRRYVPVWENKQYLAPCQATCPAGIPIQQRWGLIREGRLDEAVELALDYTPFPATVCGYLCPNLCMSACTRGNALMRPVDITLLGKASREATPPELPPLSGEKVAVVGGGPAGISVAWQLRQQGHQAIIFDTEKVLGGKMSAVIPESRIPREVLSAELERVTERLDRVHLQQKLTQTEVQQLREDYDFVVLAAGAWKPRTLSIPGSERLVTALDFLAAAAAGTAAPGRRMVIIGAGNVGCDVATEAHRLGAEEIILIDVQQPASFGKERQEAEAIGAVFRWPCFTKEITAEGVVLQSGETIPADTVVVSIGDAPDTDFLPADIATAGGFLTVNEWYQTSAPRVFAIGDLVKPGLLTDAIGAGRRAAAAISDLLAGRQPVMQRRRVIDKSRISLAYFDRRLTAFADTSQCGEQCASCGTCRDCSICVAICPQSAIRREETTDETGYAYMVDESLCIGCGFCAGACPCGIWSLVENAPYESPPEKEGESS